MIRALLLALAALLVALPAMAQPVFDLGGASSADEVTLDTPPGMSSTDLQAGMEELNDDKLSDADVADFKTGTDDDPASSVSCDRLDSLYLDTDGRGGSGPPRLARCTATGSVGAAAWKWLADARLDLDGDGLYERAPMWDADGDGSDYVTCTAKDTPDPACKVAGEVVYRDFADDLNCMLHGGSNCAEPSEKMSRTGVVMLREAVYVNWPCWDAAEPTDFNDPTATDDNLHDESSDTAFDHCARSPVDDFQMIVPATLGWQGEIVGQGVDTARRDTGVGQPRQGTYLVDDRGPRHKDLGSNVWFGIDGFIRGFAFGYTASTATSAPVLSGETVSGGDSVGWGRIEVAESVHPDLDAELCVSNDSTASEVVSGDDWTDSLEAGDFLLVTGDSEESGVSSTVRVAVRVRSDPPYSTGCATGAVTIPLGGTKSDDTIPMDMPIAVHLFKGAEVIHPRSEFLDAGATLRNVTIEPQDFWNEEGGDCSETGVWTTAADDTSSDHDCDTNPVVGFFGGGSFRLQDVVIKNWHAFAIDGNSTPGHPLVDRVRFFYGNGGPVGDVLALTTYRDIEVWNSQFETNLLATFGPAFTATGWRIHNSSFGQVLNFNSGARFNRIEDWQLYSNRSDRVFQMATGGAEYNTVRDIRISGHSSPSQNGAVLWVQCSDADPCQFNQFENILYEGGGLGSTAALMLVRNNGDDAGFRDNVFSGWKWFSEDDFDTCLFGANDSSDGANADWQDQLALNRYVANTVRNSGAGTSRVYCGCSVDGGNNNCNDPLDGSGGDGSDPVGCLNREDGSAPSVEVCE